MSRHEEIDHSIKNEIVVGGQTSLPRGRNMDRIISHCCARNDVGRRSRPAILTGNTTYSSQFF